MKNRISCIAVLKHFFLLFISYPSARMRFAYLFIISSCEIIRGDGSYIIRVESRVIAVLVSAFLDYRSRRDGAKEREGIDATGRRCAC